MPSLKLRLDSFDRPLVRVVFRPALPYQAQCLAGVPSFVPHGEAWFLVDTGASGCCIDDKLMASWHWKPPRAMPRGIKSNTSAKPTLLGYDVPLSLTLRMNGQPDEWHQDSFKVTPVADDRFDDTDHKGLIGMDWLRMGWIEYKGPYSAFYLRWQP